MKKLLILLCILSALFLIGCGGDAPSEEAEEQAEEVPDAPEKVFCAQDVQECPDGSFVSRNPDNDCQFDACPEVEETLSDEVKTIQENTGKMKSYEYLDTGSAWTVLHKDPVTIVVTNDPNEFRFKDMKWNAIYLNSETETAFATCVPRTLDVQSFKCKESIDKYTSIPYDTIDVENPVDKLNGLTSGEVIGEQNCGKRQCDIVQYTQDGTTFNMMVRKVYALPYEIVELDDEGTATKTISYDDASFDHLKDSDMEIPSKFELVE